MVIRQLVLASKVLTSITTCVMIVNWTSSSKLTTIFVLLYIESEDELSFVAGDLIILEEKLDDVWLKGYVKSPQQSGIFPAEFVEVVVCIIKYGST